MATDTYASVTCDDPTHYDFTVRCDDGNSYNDGTSFEVPRATDNPFTFTFADNADLTNHDLTITAADDYTLSISTGTNTFWSCKVFA